MKYNYDYIDCFDYEFTVGEIRKCLRTGTLSFFDHNILKALENRKDEEAIRIFCCDDVLMWSKWDKDALAYCLDEKGYEPSIENVEKLIKNSRSELNKLMDCSEQDIEYVNLAIDNASNLLTKKEGVLHNDLASIFALLEVKNPFDEKGELTYDGELARQKLLSVIDIATNLGLVENTGNKSIEDMIDNIISNSY